MNFRQLIISQRGLGIYQATCQSIAPVNTIHLGLPTFYTLELHQSGSESICSCPDFCTWGGACKHLRALWLIVDNWVKQGLEKPFYYPKSCDEATLLKSNTPIPQCQPATEPPTLVTPVLWDPAIIQSLGQDSTTFNDQETIDTDSDSSSDSSLDAVNVAQKVYKFNIIQQSLLRFNFNSAWNMIYNACSLHCMGLQTCSPMPLHRA